MLALLTAASSPAFADADLSRGSDIHVLALRYAAGGGSSWGFGYQYFRALDKNGFSYAAVGGEEQLLVGAFDGWHALALGATARIGGVIDLAAVEAIRHPFFR